MDKTPVFTVIPEDGRFVVQDAEGTRYGTYDKKDAAEDAAADWKAYYELPLMF